MLEGPRGPRVQESGPYELFQSQQAKHSSRTKPHPEEKMLVVSSKLNKTRKRQIKGDVQTKGGKRKKKKYTENKIKEGEGSREEELRT